MFQTAITFQTARIQGLLEGLSSKHTLKHEP